MGQFLPNIQLWAFNYLIKVSVIITSTCLHSRQATLFVNYIYVQVEVASPFWSCPRRWPREKVNAFFFCWSLIGTWWFGGEMKKAGSCMMKHYLLSRCRMVDWLLRQAKSFSRNKKKKEYQAGRLFLPPIQVYFWPIHDQWPEHKAKHEKSVFVLKIQHQIGAPMLLLLVLVLAVKNEYQVLCLNMEVRSWVFR